MNKLLEIQSKIMGIIYQFFKGIKSYDEFIKEYWDLRNKENEIIGDFRKNKTKINVDEDFYWERTCLEIPKKRVHLFQARTYNLLIDDDYALSFLSEDYIEETMKNLNIDRNTALRVIDFSNAIRVSQFKKLLFQSIDGLCKLIKEEDNLEIRNSKLGALIEIIFLYPNFIEEELIKNKFRCYDIDYQDDSVDMIYVGRSSETKTYKENGVTYEFVIDDNTYISFEDARNSVALGNLNMLLASATHDDEVRYEIWKMQMHLILRMFNDEYSEAIINNMDEIKNPLGREMIDEVIEEMKSGKKLIWEK